MEEKSILARICFNIGRNSIELNEEDLKLTIDRAKRHGKARGLFSFSEDPDSLKKEAKRALRKVRAQIQGENLDVEEVLFLRQKGETEIEILIGFLLIHKP